MWLLDLLEHAFASSGSEERVPPMSLRTYYRTRDAQADYRFSIERQRNGTYRAYICSQPSYGPRGTAAHETHRLTAGGRHYICWNRPIDTEEEAQSVAALWADATQEYIKTGRRF
jgi:hypothetical protein